MQVSHSRWRRLAPYGLIVIVALASHGLLLVNDGIFWDDWLILDHVKEPGGRALLHEMAREMGLPAIGHFFSMLGDVGLIDHYKVLALVLIILTAMLVYRAIVEMAWLPPLEALGVAVLSLAYPAYQTTVALSTLQYLFFFCVFMLGVLATIRFRKANAHRVAWRCAALVAFGLGFTVNSLLVFYFPVMLLLLWPPLDGSEGPYLRRARKWFVRHLDFLALPFLYWVAKKTLYPTYGYFEGYNAINPSPLAILQALQANLTTAVFDQIAASWKGLVGVSLVWLVVLVALAFAAHRLGISVTKPLSDEEDKRELQRTAWALLFGLALLVAGAFPYAVVGLSPSLSGWNTRHALLAGIPVAVIVVSLVRLLLMEGALSLVPGVTLRTVGILVIGSFTLAFAIRTLDYQVAWQARAIKDRALLMGLGEVPVLRKYSIFWVDDRLPRGGEGLYRFYEWSSMFKAMWGGESRIGLQIQGYPPTAATLLGLRPFYAKRYNLSELDLTGCQALITISQGRLGLDERGSVIRYFRTTLLEPEKMKEFLYGVAQVHVQAVSPEPKCSLL